MIMASYSDIDQQMAGLEIDEEENEGFIIEGDIDEGVNRYELCLVGRLLTEKNVNVRAFKSKMADIWKPAMGISIKELDQGLFLFQFFHKEDMRWVLRGGPWSFDNIMVVLDTVNMGEDPAKVELWYLNIWIQIHGLPMGFMTELVGKQLGNFFGDFLEYDTKNNTSIWRDCMRVKIRLDVRKPLKRKKKIVKKDGTEPVVTCKYERLGEFCFLCGMVTHTDRFCRRFMDSRGDDSLKEWGTWLRAPPRRAAGQNQSKWLREEDDATWETRIGRANNQQNYRGENSSKKGKEISTESNCRSLVDYGARKISSVTNTTARANLKGFSTNSNILYEVNEEEIVDLQLEDRKRRRSESREIGNMDIEVGLLTNGPQEIQKQTEAVFSVGDFSASTKNASAELAEQASRSS